MEEEIRNLSLEATRLAKQSMIDSNPLMADQEYRRSMPAFQKHIIFDLLLISALNYEQQLIDEISYGQRTSI